MAITDADGFEAKMNKALAQSRRTGDPLSVVCLDVDDLRAFNERYGRSEGDRCLADIAWVLATQVRSADVAVHARGDEFVVMLPETSGVGAQVFVSRLRAALSTSESASKVHVSIGVASARGNELNDVLARAKTAVREAKRAGKNAVHVAA